MYWVLQHVMLHTRGAGGRMTWSCARCLSIAMWSGCVGATQFH